MKRTSSRLLKPFMVMALVATTLLQVHADAASQAVIEIQRAGSQATQTAPAANFTGQARVTPLFQADGASRMSGASVSFEPGARTAWHSHPLGQTLIVTAGTGRVQRWDGPIEEIRTGDVVRIPPGVKHWHGAAPGSSMTHTAISEALAGKAVDWFETVSESQYLAVMPSQPAASAQPAQASRAQSLMGETAPKLAELTDKVLYGDVWERPGLSKRDRSLVTVSALIAMNRPDQLRSHLNIARTNGLTEDQLVETITHLAFYAGWPSAVTAVGVASEVFEKPAPSPNP